MQNVILREALIPQPCLFPCNSEFKARFLTRQAPKRSALKANGGPQIHRAPTQSLDLGSHWDNMEHLSSEPILLAPDSIDPPIENPVTKDLYNFQIQPSKSNRKILKYVINHIFVPPRLPNRADGTPTLEAALLSLVSDLARAFTSRLESKSTPRVGWEVISKMLSTAAELHEDELTEDSINAALTSMEPGGSILIILLNICANALHLQTYSPYSLPSKTPLLSSAAQLPTPPFSH